MSRRLDEQNREGLLLPHAHDHYPPARCIHRGSSVLSIKACRAGKTRRTSSSSCLDRLPPTMFLLDAVRSRAWQPPLFRMQSRQRTPHVCRLLDTRPARPPSSTPRSGCRPPPVRETHKLLVVTEVQKQGGLLSSTSGHQEKSSPYRRERGKCTPCGLSKTTEAVYSHAHSAHYPPTRSIHRVSAQ